MVNANYVKMFIYQRFFWVSIYFWPIKLFEIIIRYSFHEKIIRGHDQRLKKLSKSTSPSEPSGCQGLHKNEVEITKS